jgi:hypothetical protein
MTAAGFSSSIFKQTRADAARRLAAVRRMWRGSDRLVDGDCRETAPLAASTLNHKINFSSLFS